jgi:4-hydroxy-3-methylbut-2-enyl diphosphate reductase
VADLAVLTAVRSEAEAIGGGVMLTGVGMEQAGTTGARMREQLAAGTPVALAGIARRLDPDLAPGALVVATELRTTDGTPPRRLPGADLVAGDLARLGLHVRTGPLVSTSWPLSAEEAKVLAAEGAIAWDMESAWLARQLPDHPIAVVRAIVEAGGTGEPGGLAGAGGTGGTGGAGGANAPLRGLGSLLGIRTSLERWARASGAHDVFLASPRSFCAGVERAIDIVERALERFGAPVYVRRQIVHNAHVVADLEAKGAIFVAELSEAPDGATVVLAAHGVSPAVRSAAADRPDLTVIDATCPLVAKVHHEARRYLAQDYQIVLIGHADHEEVVGTLGEAPGRIRLVQRSDDVADLPFSETDDVAYLTQTTLSIDETAEIIGAMRRRFPRLVGPATNDICYATQNRQDAVRELARRCELILVVGSTNSSNTLRLVEVSRREGCRAELIEDASEIRLSWLDDVTAIGVTAGASAPEALVREVVATLRTLGPATVTEHRTVEESVQFSLPRQVR